MVPPLRRRQSRNKEEMGPFSAPATVGGALVNLELEKGTIAETFAISTPPGITVTTAETRKARASQIRPRARFEKAKRAAEETVENLGGGRMGHRTAEIGVQTNITLPNMVAAFWNCNTPDATTVVDMAPDDVQEAKEIEKLEEVESTPVPDADENSVNSTGESIERSTEYAK